MPQRVVKDTFVTETVGPDSEVRRQVFAGTEIPDNFTPEDKSAVEPAEDYRTGYPHEYTEGHGGTEHDYKRPRSSKKRGSEKSGSKNAGADD